MFKQAIKYTIVAVIWKRYRNIILATGLLFLFFWLVGLLHGDYLAYTELKKQHAHIGASFFAKWLAYSIGLGLYFVYLKHWQRPDSTKPSRANAKRESAAIKKTKPQAQRHSSDPEATDTTDPFGALRDKPRLRSRSDTVIERYPKK